MRSHRRRPVAAFPQFKNRLPAYSSVSGRRMSASGQTRIIWPSQYTPGTAPAASAG